MFDTVVTDKTLREQIPYLDSTFTFGAWTDDYNNLIDCTLNCHWHHDFEFSILLSGAVDYYINDTYIKLQKNDCVFVSSNMLHMAKQSEGCRDVVTFTATFPASLLTANINSTIYTKYFQPILSSRIEGFKIASDDPRGNKMRALLTEITSFKASDFGYEIKCLNHAGQLWMATLRHIEDNKGDLLWRTGNTQHAERAKEILSYVHEHFDDKITVEGIANHVGISRSECFRCFKRFMNKTPVEYINEYRLLRAAKLLRETELDITYIYTECGFESASYFGKMFKEIYTVTPLQYRKSR